MDTVSAGNPINVLDPENGTVIVGTLEKIVS